MQLKVLGPTKEKIGAAQETEIEVGHNIVQHNGRTYRAGQTITVDDEEQAQALIDAGVVERHTSRVMVEPDAPGAVTKGTQAPPPVARKKAGAKRSTGKTATQPAIGGSGATPEGVHPSAMRDGEVGLPAGQQGERNVNK